MRDGNAASRILLVEGPDDKHVVGHLCEKNAMESVFCISDKGNDLSVLESIIPEFKVSGRKALGIMLDANSDPNGRWQAVAARLREAGIDPPNVPDPKGTIIEGYPRVGIWLMPDNESSGELENFVARMIPRDDAVWPLSQNYIEKIPETERKFSEGKTLRAKVHAWLAARKEPRKMGQAVGAGDLDVATVDAENFVTWLRKLFT